MLQTSSRYRKYKLLGKKQRHKCTSIRTLKNISLYVGFILHFIYSSSFKYSSETLSLLNHWFLGPHKEKLKYKTPSNSTWNLTILTEAQDWRKFLNFLGFKNRNLFNKFSFVCFKLLILCSKSAYIWSDFKASSNDKDGLWLIWRQKNSYLFQCWSPQRNGEACSCLLLVH